MHVVRNMLASAPFKVPDAAAPTATDATTAVADAATSAAANANSSTPTASELAERKAVIANLFILKSKGLEPFVFCRTFGSMSVPKGQKLPERVGKTNDVMAVLDKIDRDSQYQLQSKEDSLLFRAYRLRTVTDLPLKYQDVSQLEEEVPAASSAPLVHGGLKDDNAPQTFVDDEALVSEAQKCFISSVIDADSFLSSDVITIRCKTLIPIVISRLNDYRKGRLCGQQSLVYHPAMIAFEENLRPLCEIVLLLDLVVQCSS